MGKVKDDEAEGKDEVQVTMEELEKGSLGKERDSERCGDALANEIPEVAQSSLIALPPHFRHPTSEDLLDAEKGFLHVIQNANSILDEENQIEEEIKHFPPVQGDAWCQPVGVIQEIGVTLRKLVS